VSKHSCGLSARQMDRGGHVRIHEHSQRWAARQMASIGHHCHRQSRMIQSPGSTLTYVPHFSQKGQTSPADDISLAKRRITLPQAAHLICMSRTLFSFLRKAESTPVSSHPLCVLLMSKRAPGRLGSATTSFLSRCIASAGSTPFGQTKEHAPAKWHLQIP